MLTGTAATKIDFLPNKDIGAIIASGSTLVDGMVVIPCSAGAMGAIAAGTASDLLTRAADVCLKERRPLVLCLRETPLNRIHLENMLRVHDAGAVVMPAMPAFYYAPKTIDDLVEQYCCRVLAQLGLPQEKQYAGRAARREARANQGKIRCLDRRRTTIESRLAQDRVATVLEMIKFEHSVFALPFALVGALLAARAGGHVSRPGGNFCGSWSPWLERVPRR